MEKRFIVDDNNIEKKDKDVFLIIGKEVKHIQVLRHNIGDKITVNENIYEIIKMKRDSITLKFIDVAPKVGEPNINTTLYLALIKKENMEIAIKKAVEVGVKKIVPFICENVVIKLDKKDFIKRKEKFKIYANEACKQCGRTDSVEVCDILTYKDFINMLANDKNILFAYENEKTSLKDAIYKIKKEETKNVSLIIGPEGGFTKKEALEISNLQNVLPVSLGSRILRAETAVIYLLSIIIYELD